MKMYSRVGVVWSCIPVLGAIFLAESGAFADDSIHSSIIDAWQRRQATVHSFDVTWHESCRRVVPMTANSLNMPGAASEPVESKQFEFTVIRRLTLEGNKLRSEDNSPVRLTPQRDLAPNHRTYVFDGSSLRLLVTQEVPGAFTNQGYILPVSRGDQEIRSTKAVAPILRHFQPLATSGGGTINDYSVQNKSAQIDGESYVVLARARNEFGARVNTSIWMSKRLDYSICRYLTDVEGRVISQLDVQYTRADSGIPMPACWKLEEFNSHGQLEQRVSARVVDQSLNDDIDDREFQLAFPKDTFVSDQTQQGVSPAQYVVREGNGQRVVTDSELLRAKTAREIIDSEPGYMRLSRGWSSSLLFYGSFGAALAVAVIIVGRFLYCRP